MPHEPSQAPAFAALIRTRGTRNNLLLEALQSVALQRMPCLPVVIVHGEAAAFADVQRICTSGEEVLHAPVNDAARRRGFPINVGIDYCLRSRPEIEYLFLLDDDDIVYPFFTSAMRSAFSAWPDTDIVYAAANCREAGQSLAPAYPLKPYHHLFDRNFIPSNSFAIRTAALKRTGVRVDEDLDSLEDWLFLLRLIEHGCRFAPLDLVLSEFRSDSVAESAQRYDLTGWKSSALRVRGYINGSSFQIPGGDLAQLAGREQQSGTPDGQESRFADSSTAAALHRRIWDLEHSLSWKATAPLRRVAGSLLRLRSRMKAKP